MHLVRIYARYIILHDFGYLHRHFLSSFLFEPSRVTLLSIFDQDEWGWWQWIEANLLLATKKYLNSHIPNLCLTPTK